MVTFVYLFSLLVALAQLSYGLERELTINVDPRKEDCFFQEAKPGQVIDLEYQVIDGGHGDLDITFHVADPRGRILVSDFKKPENNHRVEVTLEGVYKFCFDNTFSAYNSKTIFFEFILEGSDDTDWSTIDIDGLKPEDIYGLKLQDVLDVVSNVKVHLNRVRHMQELIKSSEARDRNLAEENFFIVNTFSAVQIVIMIAVGLIQVVMVKSLFDDSSRVKKIWKKLDGQR